MITTYTKEYRGIKIFIRNIDDKIWEYLFTVGGEIYTNHIIIKKHPFQLKYTKEQIEGAISYLGSMAMNVIDELFKKPSKKKFILNIKPNEGNKIK